jgi:zinc protease
MFKGSQKMQPGVFSTTIKSMGGDDNAFTGQNYTAYHENIALEHLPRIMDMEADRMRSLTFPASHVASERNVVVEERRQRTENDPRGYFGEQLMAMLFINHPYGNPVGGWLSEVDALTRENVIAFYKKWYAPNNAILIVSGDITAAKLKPLAERTFGKIPRHAVPERKWTKVPPMIALPRLVMKTPDIEQTEWQRMARVPSLRQNRNDYYALQVLQEIMSGGASTRLYKSLVIEQKLATSADIDYSGLSYDDGVMWIAATPADGVSIEKIEGAVEEQLRLLIAKGVTAQELKDAKTRMIDASDYARDSVKGPAMLFGQILAVGGTMDDVEHWADHLQSVTAEQVQDVAKRFLDPDNFGRTPYVTGVMLPAGKPGKAQAAPPKPVQDVVQ